MVTNLATDRLENVFCESTAVEAGSSRRADDMAILEGVSEIQELVQAMNRHEHSIHALAR